MARWAAPILAGRSRLLWLGWSLVAFREMGQTFAEELAKAILGSVGCGVEGAIEQEIQELLEATQRDIAGA